MPTQWTLGVGAFFIPPSFRNSAESQNAFSNSRELENAVFIKKCPHRFIVKNKAGRWDDAVGI
ncbi:hypothetical protein A3B21_02905 [Candidatus Uhrbacteria bacterium RIFCSPLOWO2_01_FULL_47_24]|uniref:Uncharacterized protein n=1 Tax=Candidatus Uhrbacteria bacterium RIFCSPLOWO2_01_FULL_47_24 TaxID=1802401 RepID=A0A1F7UU12_9BACT|nr:MAG: hypothetical protein A2753_04530 [Candidatus Uhrbacteria bacterium RIFCSPHIGHO2_01_FULL_47_11]OGL68647.1 MAG: hypothetical protein A3D58_01935 [Candidatus Uhrbacteria bacterium RIFCSPHIGHO2_02_FULL_46_47]OGL81214.1 MAG: hypothetical protein A3B21_02905 [Candidatus Uhrbacteria bacterium RIFCSPLOWO2_01_FULL_47_24]OGL84622.1 MAG: hypothetical protein A3J03_02350 [Candidatus Uhrbacteria bacterium RIFCSPLOWO2_02_FULL_46_25]OGL93222.1 MAG: hypothetical protein A3H11_01410 [Candidatus Uhrbacte